MTSPKRRLELFDPLAGFAEEEKPKPKKKLIFPETPTQLEPEPLQQDIPPSKTEIEQGIDIALGRGAKITGEGIRLAGGGIRKAVISPTGRFIGRKGEEVARKGLEKLGRPIRELQEKQKLKAEQRREEKELKRLEAKTLAEKGRLITQQDILEQQQFKQQAVSANIEQQKQLISSKLETAKTPEEIERLRQKEAELNRLKISRVVSPKITQFQLERIRKKQEELARKEQEIQLRKSLLAGKKAIVLPERIKTPEVARAGRIIQLSQEINTLTEAKNSLFQQMQLSKTPIQRLAIQNRINNLNTRIGLRSAELNRLR